MPEPNQSVNPCNFKLICKRCERVEMDDRPRLCKIMKCPYFTPCQKCNKNKELDEDNVCEDCRKPAKKPGNKPFPVPEMLAVETEISADLKQDLNALDEHLQDRALSRGNFSQVVTPPGVPHPDFSDQEKEYYKMRWEEYHGYFRDPSAYPLCHNLIYVEIELNWLSNAIVFLRSNEEDAGKIKELERRQSALYANMRIIREQLPTKESQELTDDEKSMSAILEKWTKLKQSRHIAGVSRILSPGAIALAPVLPFKISPRDILAKLGFKTVQIEAALQRVMDGRELPTDAIAVAEALGMIVRDRVTIKLDEPLEDIAEDGLEVDDE